MGRKAKLTLYVDKSFFQTSCQMRHNFFTERLQSNFTYYCKHPTTYMEIKDQKNIVNGTILKPGLNLNETVRLQPLGTPGPSTLPIIYCLLQPLCLFWSLTSRKLSKLFPKLFLSRRRVRTLTKDNNLDNCTKKGSIY